LLAGLLGFRSTQLRHRLRLRESIKKSATKCKRRLPMNAIGPRYEPSGYDETTRLLIARSCRALAPARLSDGSGGVVGIVLTNTTEQQFMSGATQKTAFVFAGGGSLGAVQVGMLRELIMQREL